MRGRLRDCTTDIINWCASHRLQLNENKTELAWFGKRSRLNKLVNMEQMVTVGASGGAQFEILASYSTKNSA